MSNSTKVCDYRLQTIEIDLRFHNCTTFTTVNLDLSQISQRQFKAGLAVYAKKAAGKGTSLSPTSQWAPGDIYMKKEA